MIYKPSKTELTNMARDVASEVHRQMTRWKFFADQLNTIPDADLTALGFDATELAYFRSFQTALTNIELKYRNQSPANSDDPSYFVLQMARPLIW